MGTFRNHDPNSGGLASDGADGFLSRRPTILIVTIENASSIPSAIIGMPTMYSDIVPTTRRCKAGGLYWHSSEYGCGDMLELGKPPSNYQTQTGDEET